MGFLQIYLFWPLLYNNYASLHNYPLMTAGVFEYYYNCLRILSHTFLKEISIIVIIVYIGELYK